MEIQPQQGVVFGRAPDAARVTPATEGGELRLDVATLASPSVSANHAVVWADGSGMYVQDLGSRNGTWLLLPSGETLRVAGTDIVLHLARASDDRGNDDEPQDPVWRGRHDFASSIAGALEPWLLQEGIEARVAVVARRGAGIDGREEVGDDGDPSMRIPLSTGEDLDITPLATTHANWGRLLECVWRWAVRQNGLYEAEEEARAEGLILASRAMRRAHRDVVDAAKAGARTLLLTGPSGAGKEVLAELFHRHSGCSGPFIAVNCSMFSKELLRTELFGAAAGAFTDGKQRILGAVERAQGGTLFLDEIGEMATEVQPMLLRFLDRREFQSLGQYGRTQRADVRVVAATNRDLRQATRTGGFRADLWYRLSVHVVDVPPLRARWDDVLAYLESVRLSDGRRTLREALSPEALDLLRMHPWDGNFRELTNFVQRLSRTVRLASIDVDTCRHALERGALRATSSPPSNELDASQTDWSRLADRAIQAFVEDRGHEPQTWNEQKEWNEKYLKPLLFFHMSGAARLGVPLDESALSSVASQVASRMDADRGTAAKQIARYFERFKTA